MLFTMLLIFSKYKTFPYDDKTPAFDFDHLLKPVEALDLMLNTSLDDTSVCLPRPISLQRTATFIIAKKSLVSVDDIKADDLSTRVNQYI